MTSTNLVGDLVGGSIGTRCSYFLRLGNERVTQAILPGQMLAR